MDHVRVNFTCTFTNYGACAVGLLDIESTQTAASAVSFSLGERFRSIGELEDKLKQYEESTFTKFWKETAEQWKPPGDAWTDRYLIVSHTMRSPIAVFMEEDSLKNEGKGSV